MDSRQLLRVEVALWFRLLLKTGILYIKMEDLNSR